MKRLYAVLSVLCLLLASLGAAPAPEEAFPTPTATPQPLPVPPDPNWVEAGEPEQTEEAFAVYGLMKHHGMRPLSGYAQVYPVTEEDLLLAARVAYFEAGPRSERSYRAVLCVLYNRCMAKRFGGKVTTVSTETYRTGQFSVIHNKRFKTFDPPKAIVEAARDVFLYGELDLPENVLFFCAARIGKSFGGHRFYKNIGGNLFFYGKTD